MTFIKYQHVEKFETAEVADIVDLTEPCHVFPKIDGTNGSIWCEEGELCFGSRNRQLSLDKDNQGFMTELSKQQRFKEFFTEFPGLRLYGEWMVPHSLKTYVDSAWREFYVFDVCYEDEEGFHYMHYDDYRKILEGFGIEYIPCAAIVSRGTPEQFMKIAEDNSYLMQQGEIGECIVIKRYGFKNRYGRTTWAKIVRNEFKALNQKAMGPAKFAATDMVEQKIVDQFLTEPMVDKVHANILSDNNGEWQSKMIPRLLHTVYYDFVREECWNFIKAMKNPKIDFGVLQKFVYAKVKQFKKELF